MTTTGTTADPIRPRSDRLRSFVVGLAAVVAAVAGTACAAPDLVGSAPTTTQPAPVRPTADVDALVPVGGARHHLRCHGQGPTTVLLLPGWDDPGDSWGELETGLGGRARVCAYSRFGTGTSDPPPHPQTFVTQADDLHELLAVAGEPGPYVVVGHSFGGAEAAAFAARRPAEVRGLTLIDTSPATWAQDACAVPNDGSPTAALFAAACQQLSSPDANDEGLDGVRAFAQLSSLPDLGDLPTTVITRAAPAYDGLAADAAHRLAGAWSAGQAAWAARSEVGRVVPVDTQDHYIHHAEPALVLGEIRRLVESAG
jgi:pimeloyl-ACP methyl ester carboxylesterase